MGLPTELLPYAENLYRRFPEEFIALGLPGLENVYDLRPSGTWSRRIVETPAEKTIEITIRRWQAPWSPAPWPQQAEGPGIYSQTAAPPRNAYPQQAPAVEHDVGGRPQGSSWTNQGVGFQADNRNSMGMNSNARSAPDVFGDQGTAQLARLEAALGAMKPQIEGLLAAQARAYAGSDGGGATDSSKVADPVSPNESEATVPRRKNDRAAAAAGAGAGTSTDDAAELRLRRNMQTLQIQTPKGKEPTKDEVEKVTKVPVADKPAEVRTRPTVKVTTTRLDPSDQDPASPRSPGKYSAWREWK